MGAAILAMRITILGCCCWWWFVVDDDDDVDMVEDDDEDDSDGCRVCIADTR